MDYACILNFLFLLILYALLSFLLPSLSPLPAIPLAMALIWGIDSSSPSFYINRDAHQARPTHGHSTHPKFWIVIVDLHGLGCTWVQFLAWLSIGRASANGCKLNSPDRRGSLIFMQYNTCIHMYICIHIFVYVYICMCMCVYIHIY